MNYEQTVFADALYPEKFGAGSGNRTRMACLEGRNFTIKLYPLGVA